MKTLPAKKEDLKVAFIGNTNNAKGNNELYDFISHQDPDLAVFNGNAVFDYGLPMCYSLWDYFLDDVQANLIRENTQSLIPIIIVPGTHEMGRNPGIY